MSEIDPKLGELIKKKRIERRLTQEEVAELCKIMWTLHISADEYVWPAQYPDNPTYKSLLNLLDQCDEYMLSVLLATAEALLANTPNKTNAKTEK